MTAPLRRSGILVSTIVRGCESKRRYSDEFGARAAGHLHAEAKNVKLFVYPCAICRGWHLTSKVQREKERAVDFYFKPAPQ